MHPVSNQILVSIVAAVVVLLGYGLRLAGYGRPESRTYRDGTLIPGQERKSR